MLLSSTILRFFRKQHISLPPRILQHDDWLLLQPLSEIVDPMGDCPQNCLVHVLLQSHFLKRAGFLSFSGNTLVASSLLLIKSIFTAKMS